MSEQVTNQELLERISKLERDIKQCAISPSTSPIESHSDEVLIKPKKRFKFITGKRLGFLNKKNTGFNIILLLFPLLLKLIYFFIDYYLISEDTKK